ncbi:MAG: DNA polymerase IV [Candidatus Nanohaloarchaeota archaeon QJJ-5]|nr:DNA polymerase IV [Candidatus Nanohaloarchaeota archaeon QJJ-5]
MEATMSADRQILHVDMDAFFASVEKVRRDVDDRPLVVCVYSGRNKDAGAVATSDYQARDIGIHAGMAIRQAKSLAEDSGKDVQFVPIDKEFYRMVSDQIREEILSSYTSTIEQASIDEAYLDLTDEVQNSEGLKDIAVSIQDEIREQESVSCSVGGGPNKLIAKIASDRDKPAGITIIEPDDIETFMRGLSLGDIHGIGDKTIAKLSDLGIGSVEELQEADRSVLIDEFGRKTGIRLWKHAHGRDEEDVRAREQQQISRLTTLETSTRNVSVTEQYLEEVITALYEEVTERGLLFGRVVLLVVTGKNDMVTRSLSFPSPVDEKDQLRSAAYDLLSAYMDESEAAVRRIGVRVADLHDGEGQRRLSGFMD